MSFCEPSFSKNITKSKSQRITRNKHRLSSSLVIILLLTSMLVVVLPVTNVTAQPDGDEYFVTSPPAYIQRIDDDMDGYFETARIYYDVDSDVAYAEIRVVCSVYDENTSKLVKEISETYTIFWEIDIKDTYLDYRTGYFGTFNFSLAVYDVGHGNQKENHGNNYDVGNTTLEVNPQKYQIIPDATPYDADGDGYNDDVQIVVRDNYNFTLSNASVYIDGYYEGVTDTHGKLLHFNSPRGFHEVDAFYHGINGNTDYKSEGTGQKLMIYVDSDPYDDDQDGYADDVVIKVYSFNFYPLPNAEVYIDYYYYGTTNQQGLLYAYNFQAGFHNVDVFTNNLWESSTFYASSEEPTHIDLYFFYVYGQITALDNDNLANDLDIYLDVDVDGGGTANVTVNATVYYENRTIAATGTTSYQTTGYDIEEEHIYIKNLTTNMTYNLFCELFNDSGYLEDVWYQSDIVVQISYGIINVDNYVYDLDDDNVDHFNDVVFWAHIRDESYEKANISLYWKNNNSLVRNLTTERFGGYAVVENLFYTNYTWVAYDEEMNEIDNGTFELYRRKPLRTAQVQVQLYDSDSDNFHDDFEVVAYNDLGLPEINVTVQIIDAITNQVVTQGYTASLNPRNQGRFIAEDLPEGYYKYTASIIYVVGSPSTVLLSTGWFYSYGNSTEATSMLNAFAIGIDADSDGYKNDVQVLVTDRNNQPIMNALVFYDNDVQSSNTTDMNGITIGKDFDLGWHDVNVVYLGTSSTVPTNAQAHTRFYSEGKNFDEFFWFIQGDVMEADADGEWNDFNVSMEVDVVEDVEVDVTVEVVIHYTSNDSIAASDNLEFTIYDMWWEESYIIIHNLSYNERYYANYTLKDQNDNTEEKRNQTDIIVIPITPTINIDLFLFNFTFIQPTQPGTGWMIPNNVGFYAHILTQEVEGIRIELYNKSTDENVENATTDLYGNAVFYELDHGNYYFKAYNLTNHSIEYGEFNIGHIVSLSEGQSDFDDDGYHDDMAYIAYKENYTIEVVPPGVYYMRSSVELDVFIYDLNDRLIESGNTSNFNWTYLAENFTEGYYKYITKYDTLRVTNGTFYSYGNGFENLPPVAIISKPADNSKWSTDDTIQFDGSTSYDPDSADVIEYYWYSNRTVNGGKGLSTNAKFSKQLPAGVHTITLEVDDGHGHLVTDSITITVSTPVINETNDKPFADAGSDQVNKPINTTITLDGSASYDPDGYITEYNWTMTSKPTGSAATLNDSTYVKPTFYADKIGKYTCTLGVKDNESEWSLQEDSVDITVIENTVPIVNISLPLYLAVYNTTDTVFFESNGTYDPDDDLNDNGVIDGSEIDNLTYSWEIRRGNETPFIATSEPKFNSSIVNAFPAFTTGTHYANLTVTDVLGANATMEIEFNITNVPPVANITSPEEGEMFRKFRYIQLDGSFSEDLDNLTSELYFYWELESEGDSTIIFANDSNPTIDDGLDEGDYTLTLWVDDDMGTDLLGREHNVSTVVNFTVENRAPVAIAGVDQKINLAEVAYFNASGSFDLDGWRDEENFTYKWDIDDSEDSDGDGNKTNDIDLVGMAVNYTYLTGQTYVVTLMLSDGSDFNDTAVDNLTIIVNNLPQVYLEDDIEAEVNEKITLYADENDIYDDDVDDDLEFYWVFDKNNPNLNSGWSSSRYTNVTYDSPGIYTVILNVTDGFGWANDTMTITVIKPNSKPFCQAPDDLEDIDIDQEILFSGELCYDPDTEDDLTFTWDFGDGTATAQGENISHSYSTNGLFTVTLNITDGEAWANDTMTVSVRPAQPEIEFPSDNDEVSGIVILSGTAEGEDFTSVQVRIGAKAYTDAIPLEEDDWSEWAYEWDTTKVNDGEVTVSVRIRTGYGANSEAASISLTVKNEEPEPLSITIERPTASTVDGREKISGTATGDNIERVEIEFGNDDWVMAKDDSGDWTEWSYTWNTERYDNKRYTITVRVTDADGNEETDSITVTVRNEEDPIEEEPSGGGGFLDMIIEYQNYLIIGILLLIILIIIAMIIGRSKKQRLKETEEELALLEEEEARLEKEKEGLVAATATTVAAEEKEETIRQPIRCPKCKEFSVIEDDGERPLMVECVHCGSKGYISEKPRKLGEASLPGKYEKEEEKLIIQCPKCDEMFTAEDETGEITCPNCGTRGKLNEETIAELKRKQKESEVETISKKTHELSDEGKPPQLPPPSKAEADKEKPERRIRCPNCDTKFNIPADADKIECPGCGATGSL